ncbi:hypothetical protein D869_gp121 [Caulobacter phage CcrRogue]|uniref:Uncharacterized protein n=1 Tax=Caulobacter phage CcrRogue TaxID=2927986 RepID=K4JSR0_9CAUD|nr:hypothetical protein D869_gp121 [Caulobacter phage CcrRogue]AFU86793.1 hypothetical protein CcrRogue_gp311 [Caulobacter phage CcrRogue]
MARSRVRVRITQLRYLEVRAKLQRGPWKHLIRAYRGWRCYNPATGTTDMAERYSDDTVRRMVASGTLDVHEFDEDGVVQVYRLGKAFDGWRSS